jgi:hypothetical protein
MPNEQANRAYDSPASVCKFQGYEARNRDGEVELPDDCLQIGQAASKWIDRNACAGGAIMRRFAKRWRAPVITAKRS